MCDPMVKHPEGLIRKTSANKRGKFDSCAILGCFETYIMLQFNAGTVQVTYPVIHTLYV